MTTFKKLQGLCKIAGAQDSRGGYHQHALHVSACAHTFIYTLDDSENICVCVHIYIYIYRERERDAHKEMYTHMYMCFGIHVVNLFRSRAPSREHWYMQGPVIRRPEEDTCGLELQCFAYC